MKKSKEDPTRKMQRVSSERHLNLNELLKEHFSSPTKKSLKKKKKSKSKKGGEK